MPRPVKAPPKIVLTEDWRDLTELPVDYRDDLTERPACANKQHLWARNVITSGRRGTKDGKPYYVGIHTSIVFCWQCGFSLGPQGTEEWAVKDAGAYYALINPARTPYTGIDPHTIHGWDFHQQDPETFQPHTDWGR